MPARAPTQRVLGLDPGLAATGYAVIDLAQPGAPPLALGDIRTRATDPLGERLRAIHHGVAQLAAEFRPAAVAVEALFARVNVKTALQVAQARGVALLAATAHGGQLFEYSPAEIKKLVAGSGRAGKAQMMAMVRALAHLPRAPDSDHAADALAAAICHRQHLGLLAGERAVPRPRSRRARRRAWQRWLQETSAAGP